MNEGFFTSKQTQSLSRPDGKKYSCIACGLHKDSKNPKVEPYGNFKKEILIIGQAPGALDDRNNKPWQDRAGRYLQKELQKLGIDIFEDCLNTYAVRCRVLDSDNDDRTPVPYEVECCRKSLIKTITKHKPKVILVLGHSALFSLIGHRWKKDFGNLTKWRGWTIPDQDYQAWLCPMFHPDDLNKGEVAKVIWKQDLKAAIEKLKEPFQKHIKPNIEILKEDELYKLDSLTSRTIVLDYETTGIKPHAIGHRIVCVGIADSTNHAYVFMLPKSRKARKPLINLLANPNVDKIAQNMKFEELWSVIKLRQPVISWIWDTIQATHVLDNRQGITGLKFQTYVQFGIIDYSSEVDVYIKAGDKVKYGENAINRIEELIETPEGKKKLLYYCGFDTIYEYRLAMLQMTLMNYYHLPF